MGKRILIIQGHPDLSDQHLGHALAREYGAGAAAAGHEVRVINVATLDFPLLRLKNDFERGSPPEVIRGAQETIRWAEHLVIFHPLWLGMMPAILKGFLEQALRPGFAFAYPEGAGRMPKKLLAGKSARIVITMGMPALVYRWFFGAHGVKCLRRNILGFCGFSPIRQSLIGMVESGNGAGREKWLGRMRTLGRDGR